MSKASDKPGAAPPGTDSLIKAAQEGGKKGPPPVHLWNPPFCGDLDMRIARDGTWFYQGTPIGRPALVRLFASILKREEDKFFLVTPVEKVGIIVEDAPFVAIDFTHRTDAGGSLSFETNVGDHVLASAENPIRVSTDPVTQEPAPYIHVRRGLEALIDRKSFYRLVELGQEVEIGGEQVIAVTSEGQQFILGAAV